MTTTGTVSGRPGRDGSKPLSVAGLPRPRLARPCPHRPPGPDDTGRLPDGLPRAHCDLLRDEERHARRPAGPVSPLPRDGVRPVPLRVLAGPEGALPPRAGRRDLPALSDR